MIPQHGYLRKLTCDTVTTSGVHGTTVGIIHVKNSEKYLGVPLYDTPGIYSPTRVCVNTPFGDSYL